MGFQQNKAICGSLELILLRYYLNNVWYEFRVSVCFFLKKAESVKQEAASAVASVDT